MKVIVLGGGVIGVSTAYYLARAGADVTVLERESGVALETSFANAGQVSPGYSTPWAAPGIPLKAVKWMFQKHAPLAIRLDGSMFQLRWMAAMLRNCTSARYAVNKERMTRLAEYSRDCLRNLRADTGIEYEQRTLGTLQVFRTAKQMQAAQRDTAVLQECGVPYRLMTDASALTEYEPALAHAKGLVGGLQLPGDETGDCQRFTTELADKARALGCGLVSSIRAALRTASVVRASSRLKTLTTACVAVLCRSFVRSTSACCRLLPASRVSAVPAASTMSKIMRSRHVGLRGGTGLACVDSSMAERITSRRCVPQSTCPLQVPVCIGLTQCCHISVLHLPMPRALL